MFLMEYEDFDYADVKKGMKKRQGKAMPKSTHKKKDKKKPVKKKAVTKSTNKTAGIAIFTQGEIAVVKSMAKNDVKTPLNNQKGKQKTIGAKKGTNYHRSM